MNARVIGALSVAIAAGCTNAIPLEQLPAETAAVLCANSSACLGRLATQVDVAGSCESAYEGFVANTTIPLWQAAIERGTMTYDGAAAANCLDEVRALGCDVATAAEPASCRERAVGTIPLGEPCSLSEECAGDAYCNGASCPEEPGTCTARHAVGEDCSSDEHCREGLDCDREGVCRAPANMSGGSCGGASGLSCPLDEACVITSSDGTGTCRPYRELLTRSLGEACDPSTYDLCSPELSCARVSASGGLPSFECVAVASSGASCFFAIPDMCPAGEHCTADPLSGMEGTCQALPQANEPCGSDGACAAGLQCRTVGDARLCVRPKNNGEACTSGRECHSSRCEGGVCAPPELCPV